MSKRTSNTFLKAHNKRLKQEKQVAVRDAKNKIEGMKSEFNALLFIQETWIWKIYWHFAKPKTV